MTFGAQPFVVLYWLYNKAIQRSQGRPFSHWCWRQNTLATSLRFADLAVYLTNSFDSRLSNKVADYWWEMHRFWSKENWRSETRHPGFMRVSRRESYEKNFLYQSKCLNSQAKSKNYVAQRWFAVTFLISTIYLVNWIDKIWKLETHILLRRLALTL